jgi:cytochrome b subunit of formate dehydrogenase
MKTKTTALISDAVLVVLILAGAAWLFVGGFAPAIWNTDQPLLPLSAEWSRILIALTAAAVVVGIGVAVGSRAGRDRIVDGQVIRYHGYERLVHWSTAIGYLVAFVTAAWMLRWLFLDTTTENRSLIYALHFIGAALIVVGAVAFTTTARIRGQDALFPRWSDVSPAIARLFGYLGTYGERGFLGMRLEMPWLQRALAAIGVRPSRREGKFLAAEKVLSFAPLAILTVILIVTGLIKAARYFFAVPPDVLYWSTWLHDLSTWLTLIVVGLHVVAIIFVPRNLPSLRAMITGRMSLRHVEEEFPAWADELRQREPREAPIEGVRAPGTGGD